MKKWNLMLWVLSAFLFGACPDEGKPVSVTGPKLLIKLKVDPDQERLDNIGNPSTIPNGHAAVDPLFHKISAHYIELAPDLYTIIGQGEILYKGEETEAGGALAIDFNKAKVVEPGDVFISIPIKDITPGTYRFPRVSVLYQNYEIPFVYNGADLTGTVASFVGYNTFINQYKINQDIINVNDDKLQGYWGFEVNYMGFVTSFTGQAPAGATTVPNPLFATSPIPQGSCVITGAFDDPLVITGTETDDITMEITFSTNKSFEWQEINPDGKFDPNLGENVVDMGLRGMKVKVY